MAKAQDTTSTQREKIETELKLTFEPEAASCLCQPSGAQASMRERATIGTTCQHLFRYAQPRTCSARPQFENSRRGVTPRSDAQDNWQGWRDDGSRRMGMAAERQ